ncbi:MAG TPA: hypothetical protein VK745_09560 [Polyangiaceae bacterium]|jgi:hypothetical protein|nr:hypothetical protein [Polyangiaceae bacterium]
MQGALAALRKVNFDWTAHIDQIWRDQPHETQSLQADARRELVDRLDNLRDQTSDSSPLGQPLLGPAGSGKTHLLGFVRRETLGRGMYFILADMTDVGDFWDTVLLGYLRSLQQQLSDGKRQVDHWLVRMIAKFGQGVKKSEAIPQQRPPGLINRIDELIAGVRRHHAEVQEHSDVLRALVLFACDHIDINDLGYKWLQSVAIDADELSLFGFRQREQSPSRIVRGVSWLLSLTAPTVLALDQLDAIVAEHELARSEPNAENPSEQQRRSLAIIQGIASGLLELRDLSRRTLSVVSALETTWNVLHGQAVVSMGDRFDSKLLLKPESSSAALRELVAGRVAPAYEQAQFAPPYPTYPFADGFFENYASNTPRELLKACEAHRKACRRAEQVTEARGTDSIGPEPSPPVGWKVPIAEKVAALVARAPFSELLHEDAESWQDRLIEAACDALVLENPVPTSVLATVDKDFMGTGSYDPLHARVRLVLTDQRERELHHSFRFLQKSHHSAFLPRLKAALTASGIDKNLGFRGLSILRSGPVPKGAVTQALIAELRARGGHLLEPSEAELAMLFALAELLHSANETPRFERWLAEERPVSSMACFRGTVESLFGSVQDTSGSSQPNASISPSNAAISQTNAVPPQTNPSPSKPQPAAVLPEKTSRVEPPRARLMPSTLPIGRRMAGGELGEEVGIPLSMLPYHTCVFAGSGSGKTVFLKRVVEEAALLGIPSLVLDGANDLSRLALPWPDRPESFLDSDVEKSRDYFARAEVVIWTPGVSSGNPIRLEPLPDFTAHGSTSDERAAQLDAAIEIATTSIADMIIDGSGGTAQKQTAILKATMRYFARRAGGTIRDLAALLREPPDDVIEPYEKGDKLARDLAERLYAQIENDPLIGGSGAPLDPAALLRSSDPGKTRVSVVSLMGLPNYGQKRRFVDQLSSALFSWIKKNPAPPGGILGLFVMDEAKDFVPAGKKVPGKENVQRLAAQARKYGLGLLFATQEPKSIEHSIVSNCSTLLGGKMSSPAAINALEQLLADKGTSANDVGKLPRGTFYFGTSSEKPRKVTTSLCLSYHPSTPPTESQVLELAHKTKPAG